MFLVEDRRPGLPNFVFLARDPRKDGYKGKVIDDVELDYDLLAISQWPDGAPCPDPQLGRDPANPKHYKVFKYPEELQAAGFELVRRTSPFVYPSWNDYRRMLPTPEGIAETSEEDEWFDYLDEIDNATKLRRQRDVNPDPPPGSDRDHIAEWVAKRHLSAAGSIRQVWYLPKGAPAEEIRLLEINDRFSRADDRIEPLDFGIEVAGTPVKLFVADVSSDQFEQMRNDPSRLPKGWTLEGARSWGAWRIRA